MVPEPTHAPQPQADPSGGNCPPGTFGSTDYYARKWAQEPAPYKKMIQPEVHHDLPQNSKFADYFKRRCLDINDPRFTRWVEGAKGISEHRSWSPQFNQEWGDYIQNNPNATRDEVLEQMIRMRYKYPAK
jgi:hypothetical protein